MLNWTVSMDQGRNEITFPPWWVILLVRRINGRFNNYQRNTQGRKRISDRELSWGDCCVNNLNKMAYRHKHPVTPEDRQSDWDACASYQVSRWARLDPLRQWYRAEYFILEKINHDELHKEPKYQYGSAWAHRAWYEANKIRHHRPCKPENGKRFWSRVIRKAVKSLEIRYGLGRESEWDRLFDALWWANREGFEVEVVLNRLATGRS